MGALLKDGRAGKASMITPTSMKVLEGAARKGETAPAARKLLAQAYEESGETDRPLPKLRTIQKQLANVARYVRSPHKMMVRTPWHARWRVQYAKHNLEE